MPKGSKVTFALFAVVVGAVIGLRVPWAKLLSGKAQSPVSSWADDRAYQILPETDGWHQAVRPPFTKSDELYLGAHFHEGERFGLHANHLSEPDGQTPKRLLDHRASNVCIRIDDGAFLFGEESPELRWVEEKGMPQKRVAVPGGKPDRTWMTVMETQTTGIQVIQSLQILPGEQTGLYDTALIRYTLVNADDRRHKVGLRILLDICVGRNDSPAAYAYLESDSSGTISQFKVFSGVERPLYVMFMETGRLDDPESTVGILEPRLKNFEAPDKFVYCDVPSDPSAWDWRFDLVKKEGKGNACAVMYWAERELKPGERRSIAFTYGLGKLYEGR